MIIRFSALLAVLVVLGAKVCAFSVGGYYPSHGGALRQLPVDKIDFQLYDVVYQAFLRFGSDGSLKPDPLLDSKALLAAARAAGNTTVMISVGGGRLANMADICTTPELTAELAKKIVGFAVEHGYDGVDLDWEGEMNAENGQRCSMMIRELRRQLDEVAPVVGRKLHFSITVMAAEWYLRHIDPAVLALGDWINLMSYDMNYQIAAYHAPLQAETGLSIEKILNYLTATFNITRDRINVGLPFYGFLYENLKLGEKIKNGNPDSKRTMLTWVGLQERGRDFTRTFDPLTRGVTLSSNQSNTYILYDDAESIAAKVKWVKEQGYRGVFVWSINQDRLADGNAPLTAALKDAAGK